MAGFENDIMVATNVNFNGSAPKPHNGIITTDGQLLIGATAAPFIRANFLTAGPGVTITNGPGSITIALAGAAAAIEKINVQTGTSPILPTGGIITLNGTTVAAGTNPVRTDGTASDTIAIEVQTSQAIASADATKIGLAAFNSGDFSVDANGFVSIIGAGFKWNDVTGTSATLVKENGYAADNVGLVTLTLPSVASSTFGDTIAIMGFGAGGWTIAQNANQKIIFGSSATTVGVGGSLASTNANDQIEITCTPNTNFWTVRHAVGNLTVT